MGSKKLKKKKLKVKKLERILKSKLSKLKKSNGSFEKEINNCDDRLSSTSRSYFEDDYVSSVNYFAKVREDCFSSLQSVISDNCLFYVSSLSEEILEKIALELEKNALLACMQVEIYQKSMFKIIKGIKRSTEQKEIHDKVKLLLPNSSQETAMEIISTTPPASLTEVETYSKIPTISSMRNDSEIVWTDSDNYAQYYSNSEQNILDLDTQSWQEESNYNQNDYSTSENIIDCVQSSEKNNDPLLESRNQLQKLVEQTLNETEKAKQERKDQKERDYIIQILEGDDSLDNRLNDSLSDNENDSKENVDESNFIDRLDKMRELFGFDENSTEKPKQKKPNKQQRNIWKYEKYIHLYKYSIIASEMTYDRRKLTHELFCKLFGDDSDEENELEYSCEKKYRSNCTERISYWVVKYLMPYYHNKRIVGRKVFKNLGHHIADAIIDEIQYPDEWTVKYYVSKFFPPKQKYISTDDIIKFQLD